MDLVHRTASFWGCGSEIETTTAILGNFTTDLGYQQSANVDEDGATDQSSSAVIISQAIAAVESFCGLNGCATR